MVTEARRHGVKFVWLYVVTAFVIDIGVMFPLFLIARELRTGASEGPLLRATDAILLAVVAVVVGAAVVWIDVG